MASMGAWKGNARKGMPLPTDTKHAGRNAPKSLAHAQEIAKRLIKYLPSKVSNGAT